MAGVRLLPEAGAAQDGSPCPLWLVEPGAVGGGLLERFGKVLDEQERARAGRFVLPGRRAQHIVAHGLKRLVLSGLVGERPEALRFRAGAFGKPCLLGYPQLDFSLSHCDGLVGVAVSSEGPVGLDLERRNRAVDDRVAARVFSRWEARPAARGDRIRLWTLKEAYVKATGRGLAHDLASVAVALDPPGIDAVAGCRAWQAAVPPCHVAAMVVIAGPSHRRGPGPCFPLPFADQ